MDICRTEFKKVSHLNVMLANLVGPYVVYFYKRRPTFALQIGAYF